MPGVTLTVNGQSASADIEAPTLLVELLRDKLGLTGTHVGCDTTQCGACTVHVDGVSVKSCSVLAIQCEGKQVRTIEGLATAGGLRPMQEAFREHHGLQCGYCTPGMVMAALDLVRENPQPSRQDIRDYLEGNLCRCTGYQGIVDSIEAGAAAMARQAALETREAGHV